MSAHCHHGHEQAASDAAANPRYRRILWLALAINFAMFLLEIGAGLRSGSVSLLADAIDFFGDAASYAMSLAVLSMGLAWRARAAGIKGVSMLLFGAFVMARAVWVATQGTAPEPLTMGAIGLLALVANGTVAFMLYAWREGDANMRSVWLCSRNDALGNLAVMAAALGVFGTGTAWPDLAVAAVMSVLALTSGWQVLRHARADLRRASIDTAHAAHAAHIAEGH